MLRGTTSPKVAFLKADIALLLLISSTEKVALLLSSDPSKTTPTVSSVSLETSSVGVIVPYCFCKRSNCSFTKASSAWISYRVTAFLLGSFTSTFGVSPNSKSNEKIGADQSISSTGTGNGLPKISSFSLFRYSFNDDCNALLISSTKTACPYCFFTTLIGIFPFLNPGMFARLR